MSQLYDALTTLERKPRYATTMNMPPARAQTARRFPMPTIVVMTLVVAGAAALTFVPRGRSTALPSPVNPGPAAAARQHTIGVLELRERARETAVFGSLGEAEEVLRQAVTLAPRDAGAWTDLGVVLVRRGQTRSGIDAFERSVALDSNNAAAHRNLAVALDRDDRPAAAAAHYRAFLTLAPQDPDRVRVEERLARLR